MLQEIEVLRGQGVHVGTDNLRIAENVPLILQLHRNLDRAREAALGDARIGTTGRGIGPAYEDKVARRAIRLGDLADDAVVGDKLDVLLVHHNALLRGLGMPEIDRDSVLDELRAIAPKVLPYADTVWKTLDEARRAGKRILFEGAQGTMLDIDHGTYPFVTNTLAGQAAAGSGLGPRPSITCSVSQRPTPPASARALSHRAHLRDGALDRRTRPRVRHRHRPGAALRLVRRGAGPPGGEGQRHQRHRAHQARRARRFPRNPRVRRLSPRRRGTGSPSRLDGPSVAGRTGVRDDGGLVGQHAGRPLLGRPAADTAVKYIRRIEEMIEAPVHLLSTSPERDDTIMVRDPFLG